MIGPISGLRIIEMAGLGPGPFADVPRFLIIDFENRLIVSPDPAHAGLRSEIRRLEHLEDRLVIQGTDNGRAFSVIISKLDAEMTGSIVGDGFVLVATGDCIPAKPPFGGK